MEDRNRHGSDRGVKLPRRPADLELTARRRVAQNVRDLRQQRGATQADLAATAQMGLRQLQKVEGAETNATLATLAALAGALRVDVSALLATPPAASPAVDKPLDVPPDA